MNPKLDVLCDEDVPSKHLLNSQDFEIGQGQWESGEPFYGMRRRIKLDKIKEEK